jgi:hypothetical protein
MKIKGLPRFQREALRNFLAKCNLDGDYELHFEDSISLRRLHSLWYGGGMVNIKYSGYTFHIEARGDIHARLYSLHDDHMVVYVKDKGNNGNFESEMLSYIRSDKELNKMSLHEHPKYYLKCGDHNWWECVIAGPLGMIHDFAWVLDSDDLFSGIAEVLEYRDQAINELGGVA